jgi:DNA recombination protein RmuC
VARNADDIRELGVELHDRLQSWSSHLDEMRRGLERAVDAYNRSVGALELRVLPQARRFGHLAGAGNGSEPLGSAVETPLRERQVAMPPD